MATPSDDQLRWRDRVVIAKHEINCACIAVADILDHREVTEAHWQRLTLALHRLRALSEAA
jgi:hypothetical protein